MTFFNFDLISIKNIILKNMYIPKNNNYNLLNKIKLFFIKFRTNIIFLLIIKSKILKNFTMQNN